VVPPLLDLFKVIRSRRAISFHLKGGESYATVVDHHTVCVS
jgi:hypothetical protein